ncbi:MAG: hypothetical protein PHF16_06395 [Atribacterota bacterium]|nr:hypothetical protein [Atribacterota bacterium]
MKIIQAVSYYPPHIGGVENVSREIAERMAKKGYQVEIFTSDIGCRRGKLESGKNLKYITCQAGNLLILQLCLLCFLNC